ncbi:MAG: hypothetical protein UY76_C0065G0001 [Candidatus Uhrbacteria bacterium GW2011_GWA2_52_8d]|uniref:Uncharacterized protein n=1 Tax=Candidatus Uhrbacteria bacterium GW2011_GWA2_52_8d TaxID=1618979 RepID=A0A0G1XIW3_9BACT|nr:MAG: hypothetical protein UY76_C0065G0001 [Candidatus Uhrbacteria bacterium GW2011_GWA2_52_8d]
MTSIAKMFGGKHSAQMVSKEKLADLIRQLRNQGIHHCRPVAQKMVEARGLFQVELGGRGDWKVVGSLQGRVHGDSPVRWMCATNGGAWVHAAAGWWRTREAAEAALEAALSEVYSDEIFAVKAEEERRSAGLALRDRFADRLRTLEMRRKAIGGWYDLSMGSEGFSMGGGTKPYTQEAIDALEVEIAENESKDQCRKAFAAEAPALVARLSAAGIKARIYYGVVELCRDSQWGNEFINHKVGDLERLRTFVQEAERPATPVDLTKVDLSGLFGGSVKKNR